MKPLVICSFLLGIFWLTACDTPSTNGDNTSPAPVSTPTGTETTSAENSSSTTAAPAERTVRSAHDCEPVGRPLDDGSFWLAERERLFVIVADTAELYDKEYPESYRSFQIYDTEKCDLIGNHVMPVNRSPDYPYYLYPNTYESVNQVICAQGFDFVYCYDVGRREMLMPLIPEYLSKRRVTDANSGLPVGLSVWDHFLFGYAAEFGAYAFDLHDKKQIKALLPTAEYTDRESGAIYQLFLPQMTPGQHQAVYTTFDYDAGEDAFQVKTLLENPLPVSTRLPASARNNNLIVLKHKDGSSAIGIDMAKGTKITLPAEVAQQPVQEIISWMKNNS